jgi:predicted DNA-binding transcriptional regulator AlpA
MIKNFAGNHATSGMGFDDFVLKDESIFDPQLTLASFRLLKDTEAAAAIGVSKATWWRRVADGTMPQPIRIGSITRWKLSEIAAAIEKLANERPSVEVPETAAHPAEPERKSAHDHKYLRQKEGE